MKRKKVLLIIIVSIVLLSILLIALFLVKERSTEEFGTIRVKAFDQTQQVVSDVSFEIYKDDELYDTVNIEKDGIITIPNCTAGKYSIKEIDIPEGYSLDQKNINLEVTPDKITVIELDYTRTVPRLVVTVENEQEEPVANAQIEVYDEEGYVLCEDSTNSYGKFACNIDSTGTYYFQQITTESEYNVDENLYRFKLDKDENFTFYTSITNTKKDNQTEE